MESTKGSLQQEKKGVGSEDLHFQIKICFLILIDCMGVEPNLKSQISRFRFWAKIGCSVNLGLFMSI